MVGRLNIQSLGLQRNKRAKHGPRVPSNTIQKGGRTASEGLLNEGVFRSKNFWQKNPCSTFRCYLVKFIQS
jgi:hypothetical protein